MSHLLYFFYLAFKCHQNITFQYQRNCRFKKLNISTKFGVKKNHCVGPNKTEHLWVLKTYATKKKANGSCLSFQTFCQFQKKTKTRSNLFLNGTGYPHKSSFWHRAAHHHESNKGRKVEPETRPTLQNDTLGVPGDVSDGFTRRF